MNLKEHKQFVYEYEQLLGELRALRRVKPENAWSAVTCYGDISLPLPAEYAQKILGARCLEAEKKAKEMAAALGITLDPCDAA